MLSGIYKLTFADGQFYIGSSVRVAVRLRQHANHLVEGKHNNHKMQKLFGLLEEPVNYSPIIYCRKEDLIFYEQLFINALKPSLNISETAGRFSWPAVSREKMRAHRTGKTLSEETKRKISLSKIGRPRPDVSAARLGKPGHKKTEEEKRAQSERMRGNTHTLGKRQSESTKNKISISLKGNKHLLGHKHSAETRAKMSAAHKGNKHLLGHKHSAETRAKMSASHLKRSQT